MRNLIFYILSFLPMFVSGQIDFYKQYSETGSDFGQGIVQLEDSSYVVTGASSSFSNYQTDAFLLKIDSIGTVLWSNHYGGLESDWGRRVLHVQGFGFFICGYTNSIGNGGYDYYMVKTDDSGAQEWEKSYGGPGWDKVQDAALTRDTGVIMVGETNLNQGNGRDMYIVRTDKNGDTLWTKTWGSPQDDVLNSIVKKNDSVYLIAGQMYIPDSSLYKGYIAEIHENGTINWLDTLGENGNYGVNDMWLDGDTLVSIGFTYDNTSNMKVWRNRYKISNSTVITSFPGNNVGDFRNRCITKNGEGTSYFVAYNFSSPTSYPIGEDLTIGRYHYPLFSWIHPVAAISHEGQDEPGDMIPTSDGGVVMTGYTSSSGLGLANIFIIKIGPGLQYPDPFGIESVYNFVGIEDLMSDENIAITVYPNPANNVLNITVGLESKLQVVLSDLMGKKLEETEIFNQGSIDVSSLPSGMYTLSIQNDERVLAVKKVIIK